MLRRQLQRLALTLSQWTLQDAADATGMGFIASQSEA